jgi:pantothenate kinase
VINDFFLYTEDSVRDNNVLIIEGNNIFYNGRYILQMRNLIRSVF